MNNHDEIAESARMFAEDGGRVSAIVVRPVAYKRTRNGCLVIGGSKKDGAYYESTSDLEPVQKGEWADYEELLLEHGDDIFTHIAYSDSDINLDMLANLLAAVFQCKVERR